MDDPRIEHRAVNPTTTIDCPVCGQTVQTPREEPRHRVGGVPRLLSFVCPHCKLEITADE